MPWWRRAPGFSRVAGRVSRPLAGGPGGHGGARPPEEGVEFVALRKARGLNSIFQVAPTSSEERIRRITEAASGFVYYVSLKGVTGAANMDIRAVNDKLRIMRNITTLPIGVGFGIRDARSAAAVWGCAACGGG